ncbi:MAG: hypothetical protein ACKVUS_16835 [Saprospiraceae bacterium]
MLYTIVLEKGSDEDMWGQLTIGGTLLTVNGKNRLEVISETRSLLKDFVEHGDVPFMSDEEIANMQFDFAWHMIGVFEEFDWVKISAVARATGINASLLRQYASGAKHPSEPTARRIESALRELGKQLSNVSIAVAA